MTNALNNFKTNELLNELYQRYTEEFLSAYTDAFKVAPPPRINEFGIIDPDRFDSDKRILFIGKETNGWSNEDFEKGILFRDWMRVH